MSLVALALDTSTPVLSAALVEHNGQSLRVLATRQVGPPRITSTVAPAIFDELLKEGDRRQDDVRAVIAGLGPGLFTGARVAVATMKAIAYARQIPLVGAGSLESMALAGARSASLAASDRLEAGDVHGDALLCPVLDARKGELYFALYRFEGGLPVTVEPPRACPPQILIERLRGIAEPIRLFGTGLRAMGAMAPSFDRISIVAEPETPGAAEVAFLALTRTPAPVYDLPRILELEPTYLRPPEAEVALKRRQAADSSAH